MNGAFIYFVKKTLSSRSNSEHSEFSKHVQTSPKLNQIWQSDIKIHEIVLINFIP